MLGLPPFICDPSQPSTPPSELPVSKARTHKHPFFLHGFIKMKYKRKQLSTLYIKFHLDPLSDFFASFLLELGAFKRCWLVAWVKILIGHPRNVFKVTAVICSQKSLAQFTGNMSDLGQVLGPFCV